MKGNENKKKSRSGKRGDMGATERSRRRGNCGVDVMYKRRINS